MDRRNFLKLAVVTTGIAAIPSLSLALQQQPLIRAPKVAGLSLQDASCPQAPDPSQCNPNSIENFDRGTITRPADCTLTLRLPPDILAAIPLNNGYYDWRLRLMTFNHQGQLIWSTSETIVNRPEKTQGVYFGTYASVFVTCEPLYTGWITTGRIDNCAPHQFGRVNWNLDWRAVDELEAALRRRAAVTS